MKNTPIDLSGEETKEFSGTDNLKALAEARNYNAFLVACIAKNRVDGTNKLLDFGAGFGTFPLALRRKGFEVICVEPDPLLRRRLMEKGFEVHQSLSSLGEQKFSYVYTLNVLEHIYDDEAILKDIFTILRHGGQLLVYVPAFNILFSSMDKKVGHYRRYRKHELIRKISGAGFKVEYASYVDSIGFFATLAYKLLGSKEGDINRQTLIFFDTYLFPLSRICDFMCGFLFGKNVLVVAKKR